MKNGGKAIVLRTFLALLALTSAGCGSTVQHTRDSLAGSGGDSLGASAGNSLGPASPATAGPGTDLASTTGAANPSQTGTSVNGVGSGAQLGTSIGGTSGPARVTGKAPIEIGYLTENDANQTANALGLSSFSSGDVEAQVRAIIADINAHGGLLGRQVVPVFHDVKTADADSDPSTAAQAACADWTQDHHVAAGVNLVANLDVNTFYGCMADRHTPLIVSDLAPHTGASFRRFADSLYAPAVMSVDRIAPVLVPRLVANGYFHGWDTQLSQQTAGPAKVGIVYDSADPIFKNTMTAELRQRGIAVAQTCGFIDQLSTVSSDMASCELHFRASGVTHVFLEDADATLFFMPAAEQQQYYPRYGIQTLDGLALLSSALPAQQFVGSMGVGWVPLADVDAAHDPGDPSAATGRCRTLMRKAGQDPTNRSTFLGMTLTCDSFALIVRAGALAGRLDGAGLRAGIESIGTQLPSGCTFRSRFGYGRHDSAAGVRDVRFSSGAFSYSGPVNAA